MIELLAAPLAGCLVLAGIHCYLGMHVVSRGVIFVDLALAQIAVLGGIIAAWWGFAPESGWGLVLSLGFALAGAGVFAVAHFHDRDIPHEAIIGIIYGVSTAGAIILLSRHPHGTELLNQMLTGSVLYIDWSDVALMATVYGGIGAFHYYFRDQFLAISQSGPDDESRHANFRRWEFMFFGSLAIVVVLSARKAGVLPVFGYLVAPAVAAMFFATTVRGRLIMGWIFGGLGSVLGVAAAAIWDLPVGAAVVVALGGIVMLSALVHTMKKGRPA